MIGKNSVVGCILFLIAAMAAAQVPGPPQDPVRSDQQQGPELNTILQRMEEAARENRERYRAYIVTRNYRLFGGDEQKPSSEVMADVSFVPPSTKDFAIVDTKGSSRGENVVRRILESERKDAASGQAPGAVTRENYDFTLLGQEQLDGHDCYLLGLKPKRKEKNLLIGRAWVDQSTYRVRRVQGQMAKMPSWWVKSAAVTLDFNELSGMWLQTRTKATADIRIFGPHTLTANALKVRAASTVANAKPQPAKPAIRAFGRPDAVLGTIEH